MSEVTPQLTYSPEGILEIVPEFEDKTPDIADIQMDFLEKLETDYSAEITEGETKIRIDVERSLGKFFDPNPETMQQLASFLRLVSGLLPYYPEEGADRVFGIELLSGFGSHGVAYPQFQRWVNAGGLTDEVRHSGIVAMAQPYGQDQVKKVKADAGTHNSAPFGFGIGIPSKSFWEFHISKREETDEGVFEKTGMVNLPWVDFNTLGSCACWGVDGMQHHLEISEKSQRLYELVPHNIDSPHQSLSLVLGVGSLAYHAAKHEGAEDIFAEVDWSEPRFYPKA